MQVEFFVCVDDSGDVGFGVDEASATEHYDENIGGSAVRRLVKIALNVSFPVPVMYGEVPAEGAAAMTVS
jgi:hypothetical protein